MKDSPSSKAQLIKSWSERWCDMQLRCITTQHIEASQLFAEMCVAFRAAPEPKARTYDPVAAIALLRQWREEDQSMTPEESGEPGAPQRERFTVRWDGEQYRVSIPNYEGGDVFPAEFVDAFVRELYRKDRIKTRDINLLTKENRELRASQPPSVVPLLEALREIDNGPPSFLPNDEVASWAGEIAGEALRAYRAPETKPALEVECDHQWVGGPEWDALHCAKCPATKRNDGRREGKTKLTAENLAAFAAGESVETNAFRPIESAPRDGTRVELRHESFNIELFGSYHSVSGWVDRLGFSYDPQPTHWRPLSETG